jgi:hypothetical protein
MFSRVMAAGEAIARRLMKCSVKGTEYGQATNRLVPALV